MLYEVITHHRADSTGVPSAFMPLSHEQINAGFCHAFGIFGIAGDTENFHPGCMSIGDHKTRVSETGAKKRHLFLKTDPDSYNFV